MLTRTIAIVAAAVIIAFYFWRGPDSSGNLGPLVNSTVATVHKTDQSPQEAVRSETAGLPLDQAAHNPRPNSQVNNVAREFEEARDYRILFESLARSGEPGDGLYALHILVTCGRIQELNIPPSGGESTEQDAARQLLYQRCASFTKEEVSTQRTSQTLKDPRFKDKQKELVNDWGRSTADTNRQMELRAEIIDQNSPRLLEFVGPWMYYQFPSEGMLINGQKYSTAEAVKILSAAWSAAVCAGSYAVCGKTDLPVVEACATLNICVDNRKQLTAKSMSDQFGPTGLASYETIYRSMVAALRNKSTRKIS